MKKFAAYDDETIWGVGNTPDEALKNAGGRDLRTAPITNALAAKVERFGCDVAFHEFRGVLITYAEWGRVS